MKIAFIVNGFPYLSETFILNQIISLIDLGHEVEIFAEIKPDEMPYLLEKCLSVDNRKTPDWNAGYFDKFPDLLQIK